MNYGTPITLHPDLTPEFSGEVVTPDKTITVTEFCDLYGITSDDFLSLRRKAARKHPAIDFKPFREGSRTFWVQGREVLSQMAQEASVKAQKQVDNESPVLPTRKLSDGSSLVVRRQTVAIAIPTTMAPAEREVIFIDSDPLQQFNDALEADLDAESEVSEETDLLAYAYEVQAKQRKLKLVENLIKKGYTPEQATKIANGIGK